MNSRKENITIQPSVDKEEYGYAIEDSFCLQQKLNKHASTDAYTLYRCFLRQSSNKNFEQRERLASDMREDSSQLFLINSVCIHARK